MAMVMLMIHAYAYDPTASFSSYSSVYLSGLGCVGT